MTGCESDASVPKVLNHLACFFQTDREGAYHEPDLQIFHFLQVLRLIVVSDKSHHCHVVCKLHYMIA